MLSAENDITFDTKKKQVSSIKREEYFTNSFIPSPDGAFYDIGFGMLLGIYRRRSIPSSTR